MESIRTTGEGVRLTVKVQPRANKTEWMGTHGGALRLRVAAPPVGGKANKAIVEFVAETLGVKRQAVTIVQGQKDRLKVLDVKGITLEKAQRRLDSQKELL